MTILCTYKYPDLELAGFMSTGFHLAIVGATGAVGAELDPTSRTKRFSCANSNCLLHQSLPGKCSNSREKKYQSKLFPRIRSGAIDIVLFSAGGNTSKAYAKHAVRAGAVVIDNSSAFRMEADVPLVVPEINPADIQSIEVSLPTLTAPQSSR